MSRTYGLGWEVAWLLRFSPAADARAHPGGQSATGARVSVFERVQMNRATAATLAVVVTALSGAEPLLAQGAEPDESPSLERVLKLLRQPEGSVLVPLARPRELMATHPASSRLQAGVLHQRADPSRRGGNATMIVFYSLFFGGIAMAVDGLADDPNSKTKVLGGLAMVGGAFVVSCATGRC